MAFNKSLGRQRARIPTRAWMWYSQNSGAKRNNAVPGHQSNRDRNPLQETRVSGRLPQAQEYGADVPPCLLCRKVKERLGRKSPLGPDLYLLIILPFKQGVWVGQVAIRRTILGRAWQVGTSVKLALPPFFYEEIKFAVLPVFEKTLVLTANFKREYVAMLSLIK